MVIVHGIRSPAGASPFAIWRRTDSREISPSSASCGLISASFVIGEAHRNALLRAEIIRGADYLEGPVRRLHDGEDVR